MTTTVDRPGDLLDLAGTEPGVSMETSGGERPAFVARAISRHMS